MLIEASNTFERVQTDDAHLAIGSKFIDSLAAACIFVSLVIPDSVSMKSIVVRDSHCYKDPKYDIYVVTAMQKKGLCAWYTRYMWHHDRHGIHKQSGRDITQAARAPRDLSVRNLALGHDGLNIYVKNKRRWYCHI